mgnify:CR=1 FL=1
MGHLEEIRMFRLPLFEEAAVKHLISGCRISANQSVAAERQLIGASAQGGKGAEVAERRQNVLEKAPMLRRRASSVIRKDSIGIIPQDPGYKHPVTMPVRLTVKIRF